MYISETKHFTEQYFIQKLFDFEEDIRWYHWFDLSYMIVV